MNIVVINGSPRGKNSVTLQSILYLEKHFPSDKFDIINAGQQIKSFEKGERLDESMEIITSCDLLLFSYPVYTFLAPYQLHRFLELVKSHKDASRLEGIHATQITTSMHFFDMTAHNFVSENCADLGMKVIKGFSAEMNDLLSIKGRKQINNFWKFIQFAKENDVFGSAKKINIINDFKYKRSFGGNQKKEGYDTVIVTNYKENEISLINMIDDFRVLYPFKTRLINISEFPFSGGCLGCFNCASDGMCVYKDNFDHFLRENIQKADSIIYAASIQDHSMGSFFKLYDDRQFCNGHRMMTMGMPIGYILSGNYSIESNLKQVIEGRSEVGHCFLAGVVTDESKSDKTVLNELTRLSNVLSYALENKFVFPQNFLGVGGMKIFRDLIYVMQGLMKEDHKFYKKNGIYDFPQKQIAVKYRMKLAGLIMGSPSLRKRMGSRINKAILKPYKTVLEKY